MISTPQEQFLRYCIFGDSDKLIEYYDINKNQINISYNNEEAFIWTCAKGFINIAKWLLSKNSNLNISASNDQAFRSACASGCIDVLKWLIQLKPDIDISVFEERAFTNSCFSGKLEIVKWLLELKPTIDITAVNHYGICVASQYKHYSIISYLSELYSLKGIDLPNIIFENNLFSNRTWLYISSNTSNSVECSICYDKIINYHNTPCNHTFCKICIQTWLSVNNNCPYCRTGL